MNAFADREILDLFRERPDLLAVADAVSATQAPAKAPRARSRMLGVAVVPAVAALAAVVLLVLAAPWRNEGPSIDSRLFFQRALAVVGTRPVLHFVIEYSSPNDVIVNLSTGEERSSVHRTEFWNDRRRHLMRVRWSTDGGPSGEIVSRSPTPAFAFDPFFGFATQYRDALEHGRARITGETEVNGRPAVQMEFTAPPPNSSFKQIVTVDAETFRPLTVAQGATLIRVVEIETLRRAPSLFKPRATPAFAGYSGFGLNLGGDEISRADAERILGGQPLGLGKTPDSTRRGEFDGTLTNGRTVKGVYVELTYDDVTVALVRDERSPHGFGFDSAVQPTPPPGSISVMSGRDRAVGLLSRDGFSVRVTGPSTDAVVEAARELAPLSP